MGIVTPSYRAACGAMVGALVLAISSVTALSGGSQLVSARNPAVPLAVAGNGNSAGPIVSADGRYVVFNSTASDLVPNDNSLLYSDVFVRDRQSNATILVSGNMSGTGGGNGNSIADAISADGRYVLFESDASDLVAGDANGGSDVFVRDLLLGTTTLVSISTNGSAGNARSSTAVMTPDGRFVAFVGSATNLVANDTNGISDVFVRDLLAGTTTLATPGATIVTAGTTNLMDTPVITPDGRFVAFFSTAKNLVGGMVIYPGDVFVRDLLAGSTVRASVFAPSSYPGGPEQGFKCYYPTVSDDGRFVAYKQIYNGLRIRIFRYDSTTSLNTQVNTNIGGFSIENGMIPVANGIDEVFGPELSHDGRNVLYIAKTNSAGAAVVQWDGQTLSNTVLSLNLSGAVSSNSYSGTPVITTDGRYLAFLGNPTNMVTNAVSNGYHLYFRDLQIGTNFLVDVDTNGNGSTDFTGTVPSMSADGRYLAFTSQDGKFVGGDNNLGLDVFLRDMTNGTTELISVHNTNVINQSGNGISSISQASITPDGHWLVFTSKADDLVTNDFNNDQDVFVRDLFTGTNILVSVATIGLAALGGYSGSPSISADGRYVAFISAASNLAVASALRAPALYYRDLQTGSNFFVKPEIIDTGVSGDGPAAFPVISQDGRYIAFLAKTNGTATISNAFWRDTTSNLTVKLTNVSSTLPPSMSANGRYVAFANNFSQLFVRDMQTGSNIYTNTYNAGGVALSPGGTKLLLSIPQNILHQTVAADMATGSNLFVQFGTMPVRSSVQWSADDRYFAFVAPTNLTASDSNNTNDVFLCDLQTGTVTLVSLNASHTGAGNGPSEFPAVSGNGRFVVFRSFATDIVPGVTNSPNIYMFDRFTGSNVVISVDASPSITWNNWVSKPAINGDGSVVSFYSMKPNHVSGVLDLNRTQDVFAQAPTLLSFADSDGDGIPDWWLTQYFGHPNGQTGDLSRAQDDADGDGMSNLQEYLTGTVPTSGLSVFRLQLTPVVASTNVTLTWSSIPGKSYRIQYKDHLGDAVWLDQSGNIFVGGFQVTFMVPASLSSRFYRVLAVN